MLGQRAPDQLPLAVQLIGAEGEQGDDDETHQPETRQYPVGRQHQGRSHDQRPGTHQVVGPVLERGNRRLARAQTGIELLRPALLHLARHRTHRLVTGHPTVLVDRRDIGTDPVVIAVLRAILDDAHPRLALLDGVPHVPEDAWRHVRMAHQVVRLTDQLLPGETADLDEGVVAVGDLAAEIGRGNQAFFSRESSFPLGHG